MEGLSGLRTKEDVRILHHFRIGVEHPPRVLLLRELRVTRGAPLLENIGNARDGHHLSIQRLDQEIVSLKVRHLLALVARDPLVLRLPHVSEATDRAIDQAGKIVVDVARVLASDLDFAREREVVAHEHSAPNHEASGELLVVAVTKAKDQRVILGILAVGQLEEAEVAVLVFGERMGFLHDVEARILHRELDAFQKAMMGDGEPCFSRLGGGGSLDLAALHAHRTRVNHQVQGFHVQSPFFFRPVIRVGLSHALREYTIMA